VGSIGGTLLAGAQWMGRFHPVLFAIGILVAGISLFRIGTAYGRKPRTEQITAGQPEQTIAATAPQQQQAKTYRVTEEATKSVTEGNTTITVTVRRIVEVSVAMLICVSAGSMFFPTDRGFPTSARWQPSYMPESPQIARESDLGTDKSLPETNSDGSTADSDYPVWVMPNSNEYVCYGWDWKQYSKNSHGKWMKQSQAIKQHKKPDRESCGLEPIP
jgi:hypothetical protein